MKKLPQILIIVSTVLIILNIVFTAEDMDAGFWLRNLVNVLLIFLMIFEIRKRKKESAK